MMAYMEPGFREAGMNVAPRPLVAGSLQDTAFSFPMERLAVMSEAQASTTFNLCALIDNFAMIGSSKYHVPLLTP